MKFYAASGFSNIEKVRFLNRTLTDAGLEMARDWTNDIVHEEQGEESLRNVASKEFNLIYESDINIFLLPLGRGAHIELGAALAGKFANPSKKIILWGEDGKYLSFDSSTCSFYWMEQIERHICTIEELADRIISGT